jgi:hypothetical protein
VGRRGDHPPLTRDLSRVELLGWLVDADAAAYVTDRYGPVANPAAPCRLRNLMHQLAELRFEGDGCYPAWWRAVGEEP